jgi:3-deoxy-D-manno-octulosonic-acid transferase
VFLYTLAIFGLRAAYRLAAFFHPKAKAFCQGRKNLFSRLRAQAVPGRWIWMHCASLGEFEQGRPVLEALREKYPQHKILLTFFSPSGYEVRKNYPHADVVCYLPWDTPANARTFVSLFQPAIAIFVKYEFWLHYLRELRRLSVPVLSVSTILRPRHIFFRWYGAPFREGLKSISHFFVQNEETAELLRGAGIAHVTLAGDTRFDRVWQIMSQAEPLPAAERFKGAETLMVVGSCWKADMDVLLPFINEKKLKFIIAPHEPEGRLLRWMEKTIEGKTLRYSQLEAGADVSDVQALLIDRMGLLSRLYRYGEWAYVGGAFGKGLHNILEAACYGMPIFFGDRAYEKYREATDLINLGGAFAVADFTALRKMYEQTHRAESYQLACQITRTYVMANRGATAKILAYAETALSK